MQRCPQFGCFRETRTTHFGSDWRKPEIGRPVADRAYAGPDFLVQACSPKNPAMKRTTTMTPMM
jgi:hypothetical protein